MLVVVPNYENFIIKQFLNKTMSHNWSKIMLNLLKTKQPIMGDTLMDGNSEFWIEFRQNICSHDWMFCLHSLIHGNHHSLANSTSYFEVWWWHITVTLKVWVNLSVSTQTTQCTHIQSQKETDRDLWFKHKTTTDTTLQMKHSQYLRKFCIRFD